MARSLEPYRPRKMDRSTRAAVQGIDGQAHLARIQDRARAELAAGRISDIAKVTRHGVGAAGLIAMQTEAAAQLAPWAGEDITRIARVGMNGIAGVIAELADPFA
jgi:hypothetical protein